MDTVEAPHTASRRYCMERADEFRERYMEISRQNERPAKSGLLKKLGLTVAGKSTEGENLWPRYKILDAILVEIERRAADDFHSRAELSKWLIAAARTAYEEEARPPDLTFSLSDLSSPDALREHMEAVKALGPKAKVIGGGSADKSEKELAVMRDECAALETFVSGQTDSTLSSVDPMPYRRTLDGDESERLRKLLKERWGIDGQWFPLDRAPDADVPAETIAFQAEPFFDQRVVGWMQEFLRAHGVARVYELREFEESADREIDLRLLRPWYTGAEGFWLDDSAEWVVMHRTKDPSPSRESSCSMAYSRSGRTGASTSMHRPSTA